MTPRNQLLAYVAAVAAAVEVVIVVLQKAGRKDEPAFEGRRVSSWLPDVLSLDQEAAAASSNAIVRLGTNSFPYLIGQLSAEDSRVRKWIGLRGAYGSWFVPAAMRKLRACHAVGMLGQTAEPLEPYVTDLLSAPTAGVRLAAFQGWRSRSTRRARFLKFGRSSRSAFRFVLRTPG